MRVVFPGLEDTLANLLCPVSKLIKEDLPTLERPIKAYSGRSGFGHLSTEGLLMMYCAVLISIAVKNEVPYRYKTCNSIYLAAQVHASFLI